MLNFAASASPRAQPLHYSTRCLETSHRIPFHSTLTQYLTRQRSCFCLSRGQPADRRVLLFWCSPVYLCETEFSALSGKSWLIVWIIPMSKKKKRPWHLRVELMSSRASPAFKFDLINKQVRNKTCGLTPHFLLSSNCENSGVKQRIIRTFLEIFMLFLPCCLLVRINRRGMCVTFGLKLKRNLNLQTPA